MSENLKRNGSLCYLWNQIISTPLPDPPPPKSPPPVTPSNGAANGPDSMSPLYQRSFVLSLARHEKQLAASSTLLAECKTILERPVPNNTEVEYIFHKLNSLEKTLQSLPTAFDNGATDELAQHMKSLESPMGRLCERQRAQESILERFAIVLETQGRLLLNIAKKQKRQNAVMETQMGVLARHGRLLESVLAALESKPQSLPSVTGMTVATETSISVQEPIATPHAPAAPTSNDWANYISDAEHQHAPTVHTSYEDDGPKKFPGKRRMKHTQLDAHPPHQPAPRPVHASTSPPPQTRRRRLTTPPPSVSPDFEPIQCIDLAELSDSDNSAMTLIPREDDNVAVQSVNEGTVPDQHPVWKRRRLTTFPSTQ